MFLADNVSISKDTTIQHYCMKANLLFRMHAKTIWICCIQIFVQIDRWPPAVGDALLPHSNRFGRTMRSITRCDRRRLYVHFDTAKRFGRKSRASTQSHALNLYDMNNTKSITQHHTQYAIATEKYVHTKPVHNIRTYIYITGLTHRL